MSHVTNPNPDEEKRPRINAMEFHNFWTLILFKIKFFVSVCPSLPCTLSVIGFSIPSRCHVLIQAAWHGNIVIKEVNQKVGDPTKLKMPS
jgi:hypothetical protein